MRSTFSMISIAVFAVSLAPQTVVSNVEKIKDDIDKAMEDGNETLGEFLSELKNMLLRYIAAQLNFDIGFYLYTPHNPKEGYNLQLNYISIRDSPFDSQLGTKIIVHGYTVDLPQSSVFFDIKDEILREGNYNVIVVDWTKHNEGFYLGPSLNAIIVGLDIGRLLQLLIENTGISAESVHIIGHSLGAHVAAFAGKTTENIGRISGLDAAGPLFQILPTGLKLWYTDANFVDAMHTNGELLQGYGTLEPYGDLDFFPNGGSEQPGCSSNDTFMYTEKRIQYANTTIRKISCNHNRAPFLFLESIRNCSFLSVYCSSYQRYEQEECPLNTKSPFQERIVAKMGFHAEPHPSLPPNSKFFLKTEEDPPYCANNNIQK